MFKKHKCCDDKSCEDKCCCQRTKCGAGGGFYCLGLIGAAIFYISTATSFWLGVLGFLKALIWPLFLVYHLLDFLI